MVEIFLYILTQLISISDAEALQRTAPEPISLETATQNLAAAQLAGIRYKVDPDLLLAIASHESHYAANAVGPESGGRVSCGSMTPTPVARCDSSSTILDGYLAGAQHLRTWLDAMHGDLRLALLGYASGFRGIKACASGPVIIRPGVDGCLTPEVFRARAAWIRRERRRKTAS